MNEQEKNESAPPTQPHPTQTPILPPSDDACTTAKLRFLLEADKLRNVERRTYIADSSRHENSGEHSWHLALALLAFSDVAREANIDLFKALQMAIVHDLVEIDAGDTFVYDVQGQNTRFERELVAANRVFGILPQDTGENMRALWLEFENKSSPEARFVAAFDRVLPMLLNFMTEGRAWRAHNVSIQQVEQMAMPEIEAVPAVRDWAKKMLAQAVELGYLRP